MSNKENDAPGPNVRMQKSTMSFLDMFEGGSEWASSASAQAKVNESDQQDAIEVPNSDKQQPQEAMTEKASVSEGHSNEKMPDNSPDDNVALGKKPNLSSMFGSSSLVAAAVEGHSKEEHMKKDESKFKDLFFEPSLLAESQNNSQYMSDTQDTFEPFEDSIESNSWSHSPPASKAIEEPISVSKNMPPRKYVAPANVVTAHLSNGHGLVLRSRDPRRLEKEKQSQQNSQSHFGIEIHKLLAQVHRQNEEDKEKHGRILTQNREPHEADVERKIYKTPKALLSEKYRPKIWTDLVGSERQHRFMLKWLVSWSHVVFGTQLEEVKNTEDKYRKNDALGRPRKKILLVHGAPGIGKTTVAHVLAKQAGYDAMEINASDERNASVETNGESKRVNIIKNRIATAVASQRIGSRGKPVCIIADEIDGAAENGLIRALVELVRADERALVRYQNDDGTKRATTMKRKKGDTSLLQRPIIAVCNDGFAANLRDLRPYCEMVHYTKVSNHSVVTRLKSICKQEKIEADTSALTEVADIMDGDLRSCLNLLQFGMNRSRNGKTIAKDTTFTLKTAVNRVFRQSHKKSRVDDISSVLELAHGFGDYDKLINACFNMYPQKRYYDDLQKKPTEFGEWLSFYEQLNNSMWRNQNFQMSAYFAHPVAAAYNLFSSTMNSTEDKVVTDFEVFESRRKTKALGKEILASIDPNIRHMVDYDTFMIELAPYVLQIINPIIESSSVSGASIKPTEKRQLNNAADVMMGLKIQFKKERLDGGTLIFRLEPPYEQLVKFSEEEKQKASVGSRYTVRQALVEIIGKAQAPKTVDAGSVKRARDRGSDPQPAKKQKTDRKPKIRKDFFGRVIESQTTSRDGSPVPDVEEEEDSEARIWVQYAEGFSNAVRKDITWKDFWS